MTPNWPPWSGQGRVHPRIAAAFGVTHATADMWLATAGLVSATLDVTHLRELYIQRQLTTREVAAEFGISKARVRRELAAGIERSPRSTRRPRGARAKVTDAALVQVCISGMA
jgi:hypothetical protein